MHTPARRVLLIVIATLGCDAAPKAPPFSAVADVKQLMVSVVEPAAEVYWDAVGSVEDSSGVTALYPKMMQLFMTPEGIAASTAFSDHVWLHDGLDIISVFLLLFALSRLPATRTTLRLTALVGVMPFIGILHGVLQTPYWQPMFLVPGVGCLAFAVWGFALSQRAPVTV